MLTINEFVRYKYALIVGKYKKWTDLCWWFRETKKTRQSAVCWSYT